MNLNEILRKQTSKRKLRLFSVACCNEILHLMKDQRSLEAVRVAELYADNLATKEELGKVYDDAYAAADAPYAAACAAAYAANAAAYASYPANAAYDAASAAYAADAASYAAKEKQIKITEDIFTIPTNLIVPTFPLILTIAKTIYEDKCWSDMPILADALEDNDCKNKQILDHLRSNQLHVRGCWALDLILGKE